MGTSFLRAHSGSWPRVATAACLAALTLSCSSNALPGNMLGMYKVTGTTQTNTCGSGLGAPTPWVFDVQLSEAPASSGTTLYWSWMDGSPPLSGPLTAQSTASLLTSQQGSVDSTPDGGVGPCTMGRSDDVEVTLGTGSPPSTFSGTVTYNFTVTSTSNCSDQYTSAGGMFDTLPCAVNYTVAGAHQ
jgi:hypothetical protein